MRNPSFTSLPKDEFPKMLKELVESLNNGNLISGFKACGMKKLPQSTGTEAVSDRISKAVLKQLKRMQNPDVEKPRQRRKRLVVEPGKSISMDDLNDECDQDGNLDANTDTNTSQSTSTDNSEDSLSEPPDEGTIPLVDEKKHVKYDDVKLNQWVQVVYEGEFFWGESR